MGFIWKKASRAGGPTSAMASHTAVGRRPQFLLHWFSGSLLKCSHDVALSTVSDQRATKAETMGIFITKVSDVSKSTDISPRSGEAN